MDIPTFCCPHCGSTDLRVEVRTAAILVQEHLTTGECITSVEVDIDVTAAWDHTSFMLCNECDFGACAEEFTK